MPAAALNIGEFHERVAAGRRPRAILRLAAAEPAVAAKGTERVATFVFSDDSVDRYGDTIDARGWDLSAYLKNAVVLFGHDGSRPEYVIGRAKNVRIDGRRLVGDIEFAEASVNPTAETVYQMVKGGYLNAVSVGFRPLDWTLSKDKSRPGGVDFKRQELMEVSIVPLPANQNSLALARAAGIEVDRLGLARVATISKKGLYSVSALAGLLAQLGWLEDDVEWEAEYEGDGSEVPQMLTDAMKLLGQALIAMTVEEVSELLAEEDGGEPMIMVDPMMMVDSWSPAQKALVALARGLRQKPAPIVSKDALTIDEIAALRALMASEVKAGKVLSAANCKTLGDAHEMITKGGGMIKDMLDANGEGTADAEKEAVACRLREAEAEAILADI